MEWIGITIALVSSSLASLGVNLQALGLKKEETAEERHLFPAITPQESNDELSTDIDRAEHPSTIMSKNRLWIIGFTLYIVFETFGSVFALAFISPVILAPLGASGLVFNVLWSRSLLGTKVSYLDGIGTGFIGIGTGLVSWFGSYLPDGGKTVDDLIAHLSHPSVISYFLVQLSFMVIVFLAIKYFEIGFEFLKVARNFIASSPEFASPTSSMSERSLRDINRFSAVIGILYCILGGMAASDTLLLTKTGLDLLLYSIFNSSNQFKGFLSFILLGCTGISIFIQLSSLNRALGYEEPVMVVPLFYSVYTCLSVINTIIYLNSEEINGYYILIIGMILLIAGVWILRLARLNLEDFESFTYVTDSHSSNLSLDPLEQNLK